MGAGLAIPSSGLASASLPGYDGVDGEVYGATVDPYGNSNNRSLILTDEGGFRCNFSNTSTWVPIGDVGVENGSTTVCGMGFLSADLRTGEYFAVQGAETYLLQIDSFTDTELTLAGPYQGPTTNGVGVRSIVAPRITADGTITVASGVATIASGVAIGGETGFYRSVDTLPLVSIARLSLSQRIVNQTFYLGFSNSMDPSLATSFAWLAFDGTTATVVKGQTGRNPVTVPVVAETQIQNLTISTTASAQEFRIELLKDRAIFVIAGTVNNTNAITVPLASDHMYFVAQWVNGGTAPASSTNAVVDFVACNNANEVTTYPISREPQPVSLTGGTLAANQSVNVAQVGGTNTVNGGVSGLVGVGGSAAHSAAATGNPVQIGGFVSTALETGLAANDAARLLMTTAQQAVIKPYGSAENDWRYTGVLTTTTAAAMKAAGAASIRNYLTDITYQNNSAVATTILVLDNVTTIAQFNAPANMALPATINFTTPLRGTAATAMNVNCGTTGASVQVNAGGYQSF